MYEHIVDFHFFFLPSRCSLSNKERCRLWRLLKLQPPVPIYLSVYVSISLYVCMCVYAYMLCDIYECMFIFDRYTCMIYVYICIWYMYVDIYMCIYVCIYIYILNDTRACMCTCTYSKRTHSIVREHIL